MNWEEATRQTAEVTDLLCLYAENNRDSNDCLLKAWRDIQERNAVGERDTKGLNSVKRSVRMAMRHIRKTHDRHRFLLANTLTAARDAVDILFSEIKGEVKIGNTV